MTENVNCMSLNQFFNWKLTPPLNPYKRTHVNKYPNISYIKHSPKQSLQEDLIEK